MVPSIVPSKLAAVITVLALSFAVCSNAVPCDRSACVCNGTDLSSGSAIPYHSTSAGGFKYWFSLCEPLAPDAVPGCTGITNTTAAVKFNESDPSGCIIIGDETTMDGVQLDKVSFLQDTKFSSTRLAISSEHALLPMPCDS